MGHKKNNKLLLIVIILLIILILLIGFGVIYFSTDIFKGTKATFLNYALQLVDEKEGLINSQLTTYFEKQKNTSYTTDGTIKININPMEEEYELVNNMNVTFSGKVDTANSKLEQNISINYSDDVKFPFIYKQNDKTLGIQTDYIGSKFISTDSLGNSGNLEIINQLENFQKISFTEEELKHIKDTYLGILNNQIKESNFSTIEENGTTGYKLSLTVADYKNIITAVLQTLKSDQVTLAKLNEYAQNSITASSIDELIQSVEQSNTEENNVNTEIIIYQKNKKATGVELKINNKSILQITKKIEGDSERIFNFTSKQQFREITTYSKLYRIK